jgi:hypothetical protein
VVVRPCAGEADQVLGRAVPPGECLEVGQDLHLGDAVGKVQGPVEANRPGDPLEQLVHARQADGLEHLIDVVVRVRREPHAGC